MEATLPEIIPQLVETLARDGQAYVDAISSGAETGDWAAIKRNAHPLKSMAAQMGADDLAELAETMEHDPEGAPEMVDILRRRYAAARDAALARIA